MLGTVPAKNVNQVTEEQKVEEWCRFIKALVYQESKLTQLAKFDKPLRLAVMRKLGMRIAEDVFDLTGERE